jgi:hypothetical protein
MKHVFSLLKRSRFLILLLIAFIGMDWGLGLFFDSYTLKSGNFWLNDYEITRRDHPEAVWEKVFFGNSAVISAYREDLSDSGYVNFGVDYGSASNLLQILNSNKVKIGSELVLGLNWAAMFDNMETNPNYFWNRKLMEPYSYFQRDRMSEAVTGTIKSKVNGIPWAYGNFKEQTKSYYYASLSDAELQEKVKIYEERYWSTNLDGCRQNLNALDKVIKLCAKKGIRLRVVMMPWNPVIEKPAVISELDRSISDLCQKNQVELLDLSGAFDAECFYDLGHLNYEYGAYVFMEAIEPWLNS